MSGRGYGSGQYGRSVVDESGSYYPTSSYRYSRSYYGGYGYRNYNRTRPDTVDPNEGEALYRLTPETDLLANGEIVIALTDKAYLLLSDQVTGVIDSESGLPILFLKRDPSLIWRTNQELDRQRRGLQGSVKAKEDWMNWMTWVGFAPWRDDDLAELGNIGSTVEVLDKAIASLGEIPSAPPPLPGALQLFTGVWVSADARQVIIEQPDNKIAYLNRTGWWADAAQTQPLAEPYPEDFRTKVLVPFLDKQVKEYAAVKARIDADLASARSDLASLQRDKTEYTSIQRTYGPNDEVEYGSSEITVSEALRRTDDDIARTTQLITVLEQQANELPKQNQAADQLSQTLK